MVVRPGPAPDPTGVPDGIRRWLNCLNGAKRTVEGRTRVDATDKLLTQFEEGSESQRRQDQNGRPLEGHVQIRLPRRNSRTERRIEELDELLGSLKADVDLRFNEQFNQRCPSDKSNQARAH